MQRGLRVITLQGEIEKSEWLDSTIIISYFGGSNNIFADCIYTDTTADTDLLKMVPIEILLKFGNYFYTLQLGFWIFLSGIVLLHH